MKLHALYILSAALTLSACASDDPVPAPTDEAEQETFATVGYTVDLTSGGWQFDDDPTRAKPPGLGGSTTGSDEQTTADDGWAETQSIDRVRVMVFRRKASLTYPNDTEGFAYDDDIYDDGTKNSVTLTTLTEADRPGDDLYPNAHYHKVARGVLHKSSKYDYQIVCVAYRDDQHGSLPYVGVSDYNDNKVDWHTILQIPDIKRNHFLIATAQSMALADLEAMLIYGTFDDDDHKGWDDFTTGKWGYTKQSDGKVHILYPPQLFYGKLHLSTGATPITSEYPDPDTSKGSDSPIIHFSDTTASGDVRSDLPLAGTLLRGMAKVEVVINSIPEKTTRKPIVGDKLLWLALMADNVPRTARLDSYDGFNLHENESPLPYSQRANAKFTVLDAVNKPSTSGCTLTAYFLPCRTRLALRGHFEKYLRTNMQLLVGNSVAADCPTGVINPEVKQGVFYLKRNHKYVITVSSLNDLLDDNHEFWDATGNSHTLPY